MYNIKESLCGNWKLYIAENSLCSSFADDVCDEASVKVHQLESISAEVPGNFELDMYKAGLIDDPFYAKNPLDIQKLENRHLWYVTTFSYSGDNPQNTYLKFEGIDTFADIYLNGKFIGSADNMFISHEFLARGIKVGDNELLIHIKPTVIEARKYKCDMNSVKHMKYNATGLTVRKAAHSFGWDIFPRFVSAGLWRDVFLVEKKTNYIKDFYLQTMELTKELAKVCGCYDLELSGDYSTEYSLNIVGKCGNHTFVHTLDKLWHNQGNIMFKICDPKIWWPRDMGEQNLYEVTVQLLHNNELIDERRFDFGVRTVKLNRTDITDTNGSGEFCFIVNGEQLFIRGTNWVPLDAFHSRDKERLKPALEMLEDINCNMVRCWGGGVYEDHDFFDFCDSRGILVWQDFAMGCASYPQDDDFASRLAAEVEHAVKKLRQHTSLALWAGDNECDCATAFWGLGPHRDPNKNRLTREVIPKIIGVLDPWREYLPSSPYVSPQVFESGKDSLIPENHLWGPRDYFKGSYYVNSSAHFASEMGYHGCPSPESIKKFISPEKLWPWQNNDEWQIHSACMELGENVPYAFRNSLMEKQIQVLFGEKFDDIDTFSLASQCSQAEAMKFFIERFRSAKWRRTGIIWWNLVDGWPQFSDAVVDYYHNKKIAYDFIKRSQEPVSLMIKEPENGFLTLVAANEFLTNKSIKFKVTDLSERSVLYDEEADINSNNITILKKLPFVDGETHFYLLEWQYDDVKGKNHYVSGSVPFDFNKYISWLKEAALI